MEKDQKIASRFMIGTAIATAIAGVILVITTGKVTAGAPSVVIVLLLLMLVTKGRNSSQ